MANLIYQLHVSLLDIEPLIWRRFQVHYDITFHELHKTLQVVMGWQNYHLYTFDVAGWPILARSMFDEIGWDHGIPADAVRLPAHLMPPTTSCTYLYDMGDSWQHQVVLEGILPAVETAVYPHCLAGARACPPEDCGGVGGYDHFLQAIQDPDHREHDSYLEWIGGAFDPEAFDPAQVNRQLQEGVYWDGELVMMPLASTNSFTAPARRFWEATAEHHQARLVGGSWCTNCRDKTTIVNFHGRIVEGDLLLAGECVRCRGPVNRLVEGG